MLWKKNQQKKARGVFSKQGGVNSNQAHLGLPGSSPEGGAFWRKQPCSTGRAGWQAPPSFSYKYGEEGRTKMFNPPGI